MRWTIRGTPSPRFAAPNDTPSPRVSVSSKREAAHGARRRRACSLSLKFRGFVVLAEPILLSRVAEDPSRIAVDWVYVSGMLETFVLVSSPLLQSAEKRYHTPTSADRWRRRLARREGPA